MLVTDIERPYKEQIIRQNIWEHQLFLLHASNAIYKNTRVLAKKPNIYYHNFVEQITNLFRMICFLALSGVFAEGWPLILIHVVNHRILAISISIVKCLVILACGAQAYG